MLALVPKEVLESTLELRKHFNQKNINNKKQKRFENLLKPFLFFIDWNLYQFNLEMPHKIISFFQYYR